MSSLIRVYDTLIFALAAAIVWTMLGSPGCEHVPIPRSAPTRPECALICAEHAPLWSSWEAERDGARWTSPPGQCGADRGCTAASDDGCDPCTVATLGAVCVGRCYTFTPIGGWR